MSVCLCVCVYLGDLEWSYDTPLNEVLGYWQIPMCALRTLKSEICVNMPDARQKQLKVLDANWCTSGRWGVVHCCPR